jgi:hypothetical protein
MFLNTKVTKKNEVRVRFVSKEKDIFVAFVLNSFF